MAETRTRASGRRDFSSRMMGTRPRMSPAEAPWSQTRGPAAPRGSPPERRHPRRPPPPAPVEGEPAPHALADPGVEQEDWQRHQEDEPGDDGGEDGHQNLKPSESPG